MENGRITRDDINEAMARFFEKGGTINKIEAPTANTVFESYEDMLLNDYEDSDELKGFASLAEQA
jgi:hypothetical protein